MICDKRICHKCDLHKIICDKRICHKCDLYKIFTFVTNVTYTKSLYSPLSLFPFSPVPFSHPQEDTMLKKLIEAT